MKEREYSLKWSVHLHRLFKLHQLDEREDEALVTQYGTIVQTLNVCTIFKLATSV